MRRNEKSKPGSAAGKIMTTLLATSLAGCVMGDTELRSKATTQIGGTTHWQTLFEEGKKSLRADRLGLAIDKLQAALAKQPHSVEIMNAVGVTYDRLGRPELAEAYFERALAIAPDSVQTLNNFGYSLTQQGRYEEAVSYLQRAALRTNQPSIAAVVTRNYRVAMNKLRVASARRTPPATPPTSLSMADCPANPIWIERTTARVHTLITRPSSAAIAALAKLADSQRHGNAKQSCLAALRDTLEVLPPISEITQPMRISLIRKHTAASADTPLVEVSNGAGRYRLAARVRNYFESIGQRVGRLTNDSSFTRDRTVIFYRKAHAGTARRLADLFPITVKLVEAKGQTVDIRVRLGGDVLNFDSNVLMKEHGV